jgi:hypothetical protein
VRITDLHRVASIGPDTFTAQIHKFLRGNFTRPLRHHFLLLLLQILLVSDRTADLITDQITQDLHLTLINKVGLILGRHGHLIGTLLILLLKEDVIGLNLCLSVFDFCLVLGELFLGVLTVIDVNAYALHSLLNVVDDELFLCRVLGRLSNQFLLITSLKLYFLRVIEFVYWFAQATNFRLHLFFVTRLNRTCSAENKLVLVLRPKFVKR